MPSAKSPSRGVEPLLHNGRGPSLRGRSLDRLSGRAFGRTRGRSHGGHRPPIRPGAHVSAAAPRGPPSPPFRDFRFLPPPPQQPGRGLPPPPFSRPPPA